MTDKLNEGQNTGVIILPPTPLSWVAGGETGIVYEENIANGDWTQYLPTREKQKFFPWDTNACVSFSCLNSIETQINYLIKEWRLPILTLIWLYNEGYLDENGLVNFSDRALAKMSGTTRQGNNLEQVWNTARTLGMVPEKDWNYIKSGSSFATWDLFWSDYYQEIPQWILDKAKRFKDYFNINHEWVIVTGWNQSVPDDIMKHLKQAPLQIASYTCSPWNTDKIIKSCGNMTPAHATLIYKQDAFIYHGDFDHYEPYEKKLAWDYPIPYAVKGLVTIKSDIIPEIYHHNFTVNLQYNDSGEEVSALQRMLKQEGLFKLEPTGYFGSITLQAVKDFQLKYSSEILAPLGIKLPTGRVFEMTRKKLSNL